MSDECLGCSRHWRYGLFCAGAMALFLFGALCRSGQIMGQDEISHYYKLVGLLFHQGYRQPAELITFSPHLYPLSAWGLCELLGHFSPFATRLCGVAYWLGALLLLAWLCRPRQTTAGEDTLWLRRALPLLFLGCMPMVLQAAVIIDIDQTALPFYTLLLCCAVREYLARPAWCQAALAALALTAALWCRLSTPLLLLPLFLGVALLQRRRWQRVAVLALALLTGWLLFVVSWRLYGQLTGVNAAGVFDYLRQSFGETTVGARATTRARHSVLTVLYLFFWGLNPFVLLALALSAGQQLRRWWQERRLRPNDVYLLAGLWLLAGYGVVGGALFGFPKYHCPALPLLALGMVLSGDGDAEPHAVLLAEPWRRLLVLFGFSFALALAFLGDPLLVLRSEVRAAQAAFEPLRPMLLPLAWRLLLVYGGAGLVLLLALRQARTIAAWTPALLAVAMGLNAALACRQQLAPYATGYIYGDCGETLMVAAMIRDEGWSDRDVIVPVEVWQGMAWEPRRYGPPQNWSETAAMAQRIEEEKPRLVALSPLINPVPQVQTMTTDPAMHMALRDYCQSRLGGRYWLWLRRE